MIFWTEIAAGGKWWLCSGSVCRQASHTGICPAWGLLLISSFSIPPPPSSLALVHNVPAQPGSWYCWEPVSHTEEHWDGFRLDLGAFPQVLIAWQRGVDCFFLPGSNGINNVVSHRYLLHIHTCSNPSASLVARSSNETSEPMKTTVVWSGFWHGIFSSQS